MAADRQKTMQNVWELRGISKRMTERRAKLIQKLAKDSGCKLVLDVGCAEGYVTSYLAEIPAIVVGIDVDPAYLHLAKQKLSNASFINASFENMPFRDGIFDSIIILEVLEHLFEAEVTKGLVETFRLIKKDGSLFISVPYKETIRYVTCTNCKNLTSAHPSGHLRSLDDQVVASLLPQGLRLFTKIHMPNTVRVSCTRLLCVLPISLWLKVNNFLGLVRRKGYWIILHYSKT
jgi:ubiquinone/menaquinone biosynthesis C-methylase UbiE